MTSLHRGTSIQSPFAAYVSAVLAVLHAIFTCLTAYGDGGGGNGPVGSNAAEVLDGSGQHDDLVVASVDILSLLATGRTDFTAGQ